MYEEFPYYLALYIYIYIYANSLLFLITRAVQSWLIDLLPRRWLILRPIRLKGLFREGGEVIKLSGCPPLPGG